MTLIIGLGNQDQVVLISDRRLSSNGKVYEDESNKASTFVCMDARLAVAFTGLAKAGSFLTRRWLLEALLESAKPDYMMRSTIIRLRDRATRDFAKLTNIRKQDKRLTIVLAGYCYDEEPPRCYLYQISNFEGFDDNQSPLAQASDKFSVYCMRESRPAVIPPAIVLVAGAYQALSQKHVNTLGTLLREKRPPPALVDRGVEILREVAKSEKSRNLIGTQCTSIVLPSDPALSPLGNYHSSKPTHKTYLPSHVVARGAQGGSLIIDSPEFYVEDSSGTPEILNVPKVGRNWPCPCGSGKKYKKCHGQTVSNKNVFSVQFGS
jgi:hypothetical protein